MKTAHTTDEVRAWERNRHATGETIALVPTMGAIHQGHLALVRRARQIADHVAVSIYVNPTQFGPAEDLSTYPRPLGADLDALASENVALVFTPDDTVMYPEGFRTHVEVEGLADLLEGAARPGHFRGVCTVVLKLFHIVRPDVAVFGWKDAQQFLILRRMVADLDLPVRLEPVETVREPDGLALSSRNGHLTPDERRAAPALHRALQAALARIIAGARDTAKIDKAIRDEIATEPLIQLDRLDIVHTDTFQPLGQIVPNHTLIALAAHLGRARLIDNIRV